MMITVSTRTSIGPAGLLAVARAHAARPADWSVAPGFDPARRWYRRLAEAADHEVWLLTWLPGQGTDLHDHGGSAGAFVVVSGTLAEQVPVARRGQPGRRDLADRVVPTGGSRRFGPAHVHRLVNVGEQAAVSVHAYGPALRLMTRYRLAGGQLHVEAVRRVGKDW